MENYLTEDLLELFLKNNFKEGIWIRNKKFLNFNFRPDFVNDYYKMVVEFDGYFHFSSSKTIIRDKEKDKIFNELNYKIIRIPYFVQLDKFGVNYYFKLNCEFNNYKHGFIDKKAFLPSDFCSLGLLKFKEIMINLKNDLNGKVIYNKILLSLFNNTNKIGEIFPINFINYIDNNCVLNEDFNKCILKDNNFDYYLEKLLILEYTTV